MDLLKGGGGAYQRVVGQQVVHLGQGPQHLLGAGGGGQALNAQGHLDHDLGQLVGRFADGPAAVGGLAPGGPVDRDVGPDPGGLLLAGERVGGLPGDVAEEDEGVEQRRQQNRRRGEQDCGDRYGESLSCRGFPED